MQEIISIIMQRDNLNYEEAKEIVEETKQEILETIAYMTETDDDPFCMIAEVEDILANNLGLEPDYLDAFLL